MDYYKLRHLIVAGLAIATVLILVASMLRNAPRSDATMTASPNLDVPDIGTQERPEATELTRPTGQTSGTSESVDDKTETVTLYDVPFDAELQRRVISLCEDRGVDPTIIFAMCFVESTYNSSALGDGRKAFGLMQIHPRWHEERMARLDVTDLFDPYQNILVGVDFLCELIVKYDGNVEMALMAYNAGCTGAYRYWFSQGVYTNTYSQKVLDYAATIQFK